MIKISPSKAIELLQLGFSKAKVIISDNKKFEELLNNADSRLKKIPAIGDKISILPNMIMMLNSYFHKEYTDMSMSAVVALTSALLYFVTPIDAIIDGLPLIGLIDDAAVLTICYKTIEPEVKKYEAWKERQKKK